MKSFFFGALRMGAACAALGALGGAGCSSKTDASATSSAGSTSSTSSTSTSSSSSSSSSGANGPIVLGKPLTEATPGTWTWVPFSDAYCANGETTGIGVNISTASPRVVIYLEGGGACWSDITCYTLMTAANVTAGYGASNFTQESTDATYLALPGGFFDRTAADNPFKDYSYIYVPYCTGDVVAGDNVVVYPHGPASGTKQVGYANMTAFLSRIVPTFPNADKVFLSGSSAGGFGAAINWWQAQQYFGPKIEVDLIDDSGTPMPLAIENAGMGEDNIRAAWNLAATLPPGCTGCSKSLDAILPYYDKAYPTHRAALLSYYQDTVLPNFYQVSTTQFETGITQELTSYFEPIASFKWFTSPNAGHVLWFDPTLTTNGVTVKQFLTQMVTDDPSWAAVPANPADIGQAIGGTGGSGAGGSSSSSGP
jgi:hypothetical protein